MGKTAVPIYTLVLQPYLRFQKYDLPAASSLFFYFRNAQFEKHLSDHFEDIHKQKLLIYKLNFKF